MSADELPAVGLPQDAEARRGPGRPRTHPAVDDLPPDLLRRIHEVIDAASHETAAAIYRRFALVDLDIDPREFRRYVAERRATSHRRPPAEAPAVPTWEQIDEECRRRIMDRLDAGDVKVYEAVGIVSAASRRRLVALQEAAERRAEEIHEQKMADYRRRAEAALAEAERPGVDPAEALARLREDVRQIYGLSTEGDA